MDIDKIKEQHAAKFQDCRVPVKRKSNTAPTMDKEKVTITYNEDDKTFNIYLTDIITGPEDYTNVFDTFVMARDDENIRVFLSTPGGRLDTTNKIRGLAQLTKANTLAIVGDVASAGTILALSFDDIIVMPNIEFMIHNYSGGAFGKGHEIYSHVNFLKEEMPRIFRDFYKDFLTEEEIILVISGQDLYLNAEQVVERWDRVLAARDELVVARQKEQLALEIEATTEFLISQGYTVTGAEPKPKKRTK